MTLLIDHEHRTQTGTPFAPKSDWRAMVDQERTKAKLVWAHQARQVRIEVAEFILRRAQKNRRLSVWALAAEARRQFGTKGVVPSTEVSQILRRHGLDAPERSGHGGTRTSKKSVNKEGA